MTPSGLRPTLLCIALVLGALSVASACAGDKLPRFANPPPVDGGLADASDDDAARGD